jgi:clorobiocin biosynthesis protein CloN6
MGGWTVPEPLSTMSASAPTSLPALTADLLLLHPPAFFDFRGRRDVYFPFLGTSGDVPITPLYEFFPLGFKKLQRYLSARGRSVRILNLGSLLVRHPGLDVEAVVSALDVKVLGIDLHWMIHAQGSLAVAELVRRLRPDLPIVFGGITSTYFARELIRYPFVDLVMRGYDTLEPMARLMDALEQGAPPREVPNLLWKTPTGQVVDNGLTHTPEEFGCGVDWSVLPAVDPGSLMSVREITTTHNAGCSFACGYCGGSRDAFRRLYGTSRGVSVKPAAEIDFEMGAMGRGSGNDRYHLYAMGLDSLGGDRAGAFLDQLTVVGARSVNYEQYFLPSDETVRRMVGATDRALITLSPESHDLEIARAAGRGVYTNEELERWLERALELGIKKVDLWYFVGMPGQDERSVMQTVDYCDHLLQKFKGRADPMICPLIPNLDPASNFFESPEQHGYRVHSRTLEDHRRAASRASPINRINYETRWMDRSQIFYTGYRAIRAVLEAKARIGMFPETRIAQFNGRLDDAVEFTRQVHRADSLPVTADRARALEELGDGILSRNEAVLYQGVIDQTYPIRRQIGGRWCDELGWTPQQLAAAERP